MVARCDSRLSQARKNCGINYFGERERATANLNLSFPATSASCFNAEVEEDFRTSYVHCEEAIPFCHALSWRGLNQ